MSSPQDQSPFIEARNLEVYFSVRGRGALSRKTVLKAVDGIDLSIQAGQTVGLVGESGCGKSTTGRALVRLIEPTGGTITLEGEDLGGMSGRELRRARQKMQVVFQDPFGSLNPRMRVSEIIGDPLAVHGMGDKSQRLARSSELLEMVGLESQHLDRYPHEFSGGQRQRIAIARALAVEPKFVVADEAVSALDVSIQAQILNLLVKLREELNLTYLFIAHDLAVVRHFSDLVAVMYLGRIVEMGPPDDIYERGAHPYTRALVSSIPLPNPKAERLRERIVLDGDVPSPIDPPPGCPFHNRCWMYRELDSPEICRTERPDLRSTGHEQVVACHFWEEVQSTPVGISHL
jgi:oligopeptide/dipeptide ABC transporter ATP-binding protein